MNHVKNNKKPIKTKKGMWVIDRVQIFTTLCTSISFFPHILCGLRHGFSNYVNGYFWDGLTHRYPNNCDLETYMCKIHVQKAWPIENHKMTWCPFYSHGLTSISAWISNYIHWKMWDKITYPFPNSNGATVEVWELISYFIPHITEYWLLIHGGITVNLG